MSDPVLLQVSTSAIGEDFVHFDSTALTSIETLKFFNDTNVDFFLCMKNGMTMIVKPEEFFAFYGLSNANELYIRRLDLGSEPAVAKGLVIENYQPEPIEEE